MVGLQFLKKWSLELPWDPAIPLTGIYSREFFVHTKSCTFIEALFTLAKRGKQPKCQSVDQRINTLWFLHTIEYYPAIKKRNTDTSYSLDEYWKYHAKQKKQRGKRYGIGTSIVTERLMILGLEGGKNEIWMLMDMEYFLGGVVMYMFWY